MLILLAVCAVFASTPIESRGLGATSHSFDVRNVREYFLQAEKVAWDYLPDRVNNADTSPETQAFIDDTLKTAPGRVGSVYSKYVFKGYTDSNFTDVIPTHPTMGYQGPLLHVEVGEILLVHFRNKIDIPVSLHPHGVRYDKLNEGAKYEDDTSGQMKAEDAVPPGEEITYTWKLDAEFGPKDGDPNCLPLAYHSHVNPLKEVNTGLLGLIVLCREGTLNSAGLRGDVNREYVLYFDTTDEEDSWLLDENLERCGDPDECKRLLDEDDEAFLESLKKDAINGYMYGNMPEMEACVGERVVFYMYALNAELHPVNIRGHTFEVEHQRTSIVGIWPATFRSANLLPLNEGKWLIQCFNSEHNKNGMKAFFNVQSCGDVRPEVLSGVVRSYYFAAETEDWDYAPTGQNMYTTGEGDLTTPWSPSEPYFAKTFNGKKLIGGVYKKARFIRYTDDTFTAVMTSEEDGALGILGPVIRAEVGDTIKITLKNLTPFNTSIYLQGVSVDKQNDGQILNSGKIIDPDNVGTYTYTVPPSVAPDDADGPCITYLYYSATNLERDVSSGLVGPLVLCRHGALNPDTGIQWNVDRELFLYFSSIDENFSWYIDDNIHTYIGEEADTNDDDFVESNVMRSINGRSFANLEMVNICKGEKVVWHVLSFGQTEGLHGVTFNGNNVMIDGKYRDSHVTISGLTFDAIMVAENTGTWSIRCQNDIHHNAGMVALYNVSTCGTPAVEEDSDQQPHRRYYIAAVEREWNYAPVTIIPMTGENFSHPSSDQYGRVQKDGIFLGSVYMKALYREYTDDTFQTEKPRRAKDIHLGVMGPFIKAEVGEVIEVVFKNMASRSYSIHAQGLKYTKQNEGMPYKDTEENDTTDAVAPDTMVTYRWHVPLTSGPPKHGPNCVGYMYHSAVDPVKDTYSGLVGPIVICKPGILNSELVRQDSVEREYALLFQAFNENESWYYEKNIELNGPVQDTTSEDFYESNLYDSINGLVYDNVRGLVANVGENIAWHLLGLGESEDLHTVHFHGLTVIQSTPVTRRLDVVEVFPGTYETVEMFASNPGKWSLHCHVGFHSEDGMIASYTVIDRRPKRPDDMVSGASFMAGRCIAFVGIFLSFLLKRIC